MHFGRPLSFPDLLIGEYEGSRIPLHTHEAVQLVLPVTSFIMLAGSVPVATGPGDIWLGTMQELHGAVSSGVPCRARLLLLPPDLLQEMPGGIPRFGRTPLFDPILAHAFSEPWSADQLQSLLAKLLQHRAEAERPLPARRMDRAIRRAQEHLQLHVTEQHTLEELAGIAQVSKSYLVREFHRMVGLPPHAYHLQLRIARAARLLALGLPLSRVAFDAGFADQSHLSRRFKSAYGLTPLAFARSVRLTASMPFDSSAGQNVA
ncbi:MAG TPA: AraC family transcriptional regulator [Gemmatimonadales bacterium]|nr:AraC family transcriptional regulator [Gemmatimonadales bacterium]